MKTRSVSVVLAIPMLVLLLLPIASVCVASRYVGSGRATPSVLASTGVEFVYCYGERVWLSFWGHH